MSNINKLKKCQAATGLLFGVFVAVHLSCHYTLNLGVARGNSTLLLARRLYRNPLSETLLVLCLMGHMYSNTQIILARRKAAAGAAEKKADGGQKKPVAGAAELKAHRIAGYVLGFSIFGHVAATRIMPLVVLDDPATYDYSFVAYACALFSVPFTVYLVILGMAGGWHLLFGARSALATLSGKSVVGKSVPILLKVVSLCSHVAIGMGVVKLAGSWREADEKAELQKELYKVIGI